MKEGYFNTVVKKLSKHKGKIIGTEKIKNILKNILDTNYSDEKVYKMIYHLKNRGHLISAKKDLFFVKDQDENTDDQKLIENFYWTILRQHCKKYLRGNRYIGSTKALELNMMNFEIPEEINIINGEKQSVETIISDKKIKFKKFKSMGKDLFSKFFKYCKKIIIGGNTLNIAGFELAMLESLYNQDDSSKTYTNELIKNTIRKYQKNIDLQKIGEIIKLSKHHSSINKLYKIAKDINETFANEILKLIKRHSFVL